MSRMTRMEKRQYKLSELQRINRNLTIKYLRLQAKYFALRAKILEAGIEIDRKAPIPANTLEAERIRYYKLLERYKKLRARMLEKADEQYD